MTTERKVYWGLGVGFLLLFLFFPWMSFTVAPEMRVLILDEHGNAAPGAVIQEKWEYKTIGSKQHREVSKAGQDGYALFPPRTERIALIKLLVSIPREIIHLPHGYGFGPVYTIWAYGDDQFVWTYVPLSSHHPAPPEMRLKRHHLDSRLPNDNEWP